MRAREFIVEDTDVDTIQGLAERIKKDCGTYLANSSWKHFLWRGIRTGDDEVMLDVPLVTRSESYTGMAATKALSGLMAADGFKATRMSTFTTTDRGHASGFGEAYCVFPVGDYSLTYHDADQLKDRYLGLTRREPIMRIFDFNDLGDGGWQRIAITTSDEYDNIYMKRNSANAQILAELFWKKYKDCFGQTLNPDEVRGSEIMLAGSKAHFVDPESFTSQGWREFLKLIYGEEK